VQIQIWMVSRSDIVGALGRGLLAILMPLTSASFSISHVVP
jgi:hypothetical protein